MVMNAMALPDRMLLIFIIVCGVGVAVANFYVGAKEHTINKALPIDDCKMISKGFSRCEFDGVTCYRTFGFSGQVSISCMSKIPPKIDKDSGSDEMINKGENHGS